MKNRYITALLVLVCMLAFTAEAAQEMTKESRSRSKKQGWLGVGIQDVTPKFARDHELKIKEGAYINEVVEESPADSAGLKEEDVIVEFNGKKIEAAEDLTEAVAGTKPGTKVTVKINRNGDAKSLSVTVGKNRMRMPFAITAPRAPRVIVNMFGGDIEGMDLMDVNKQLGEYFEVPGGKGVLVKGVEKGENAAKAGIKAGDVITKIGDETINNIGDIHDAVSDLDEGDKVNVELIRKGKKTTVSLEISDDRDDDEEYYWQNHMPGNFNFHFQPQLEQMQKELELQMEQLPRKHKELRRVESTLPGKEI
ncbi:MAG: PDZ domain-containing protein [Bacteroidota bacterium]